jgi:branched-subunit amino acid transport protein
VTAWTAVLAVALGSFAFRVGPLLAADRTRFVRAIERRLRFAAPAATAALAVRALDTQVSAAEPQAAAATLAAVVVGLVLAARGRSLTVVASVGVAASVLVDTALSTLG